jgi:ubiquinone/menaquinone biosynthesis C-methylase UbiE
MRADPRETFGKNARFYAASQAHTEEKSLKALADLAEAGEGKSALDVATGAGHTAAALAREGASVTAIDITPQMLGEARRLYSKMGIEWILGDVMHLPFNDDAFDLVVSRRAPHHFIDIRGALMSMASMLRHGGALVVDDRSVPEDDFVDMTMNGLDKLHDRSHVRDYRLSEWVSMLGSVGLQVVHAELYEMKRPLDSLTATASEEDAREIGRALDDLGEDGRRRMGIEVQAGEITVTHWFVLVKALKP